MDLTTLTDAGAESPRLRLPLPSSAPLVGAAGAEGGRCGGTLTPSPSPALRERDDLVSGSVDRRWRRIATAMLTSPLFRTLGGSGRGGRGKVRGIIPPSSPAAWERKGGWGEGEGHQACSAALAPKSPKPFSTASRRCMRCLLAFAETLYRVPLANLSKSLGF